MDNTSIKLYFLWVCWRTSYDNYVTINRILGKARKSVGCMVVCPPHSHRSCKLYTEMYIITVKCTQSMKLHGELIAGKSTHLNSRPEMETFAPFT